MSETHQITYANSTFTRTSVGGASGYGWHSPRWTCDVCGRKGMGDMFIPSSWAETCARGHQTCPWCGKQCPVLMDGSRRVHTGCKQRPEPVESDWLAAKEAVITVRSKVAEGKS